MPVARFSVATRSAPCIVEKIIMQYVSCCLPCELYLISLHHNLRSVLATRPLVFCVGNTPNRVLVEANTGRVSQT